MIIASHRHTRCPPPVCGLRGSCSWPVPRRWADTDPHSRRYWCDMERTRLGTTQSKDQLQSRADFMLQTFELASDETHSCWCPWPRRWCPWAAGECRRAALSYLGRIYPLGAQLGAPSLSRRCTRRTWPGQMGARARSSKPPTCTWTHTVLWVLCVYFFPLSFAILKYTLMPENAGTLTKRLVPSYSQRSILSSVASEK